MLLVFALALLFAVSIKGDIASICGSAAGSECPFRRSEYALCGKVTHPLTYLAQSVPPLAHTTYPSTRHIHTFILSLKRTITYVQQSRGVQQMKQTSGGCGASKSVCARVWRRGGERLHERKLVVYILPSVV